jgi:COP9 signalosome complex subunit 1
VALSTLVKESIREGHARLGDLLYSRGEITEAFRQYLRTRDYCTTPQQTVAMCINVVKCALEMKNYLHINTYVQKAEAFPAGTIDLDALGQLRAAQGVAYLAQGKYELAAKAFTSLPLDLGSSFSDVLSAGDVATYGTLCALATMGRSEVSSRVVNAATFRDLLNQAPEEVRDAANDFFSSRYGTALMALERLRPVLMLDPYLADHVQPLLAAVRAQAVTQYTKPFTSLDLVAMASAFNTDEASLEQELVTLIASKQISGRIDTHSKAFLSTKEDARTATYRAAINAAEHYLRSTKTMLLRAGMMRYDLIRRPAAGERPDRPERPECGEGPRSGAFPRERGEGSGRRQQRGASGGGGEGKGRKEKGGGSKTRHDDGGGRHNTNVAMLAD